MFRAVGFLTLIAAIAGGGYFLANYRVKGLRGLDVSPRSSSPETSGPSLPMPASMQHKAIRIATINFEPMDRNTLAEQHVAGQAAALIRRFDVVALQDIRARNQGLMLELLEQVNSLGHKYDFATCQSVGRETTEQYSAFLFNRANIEIDRSTVYSVSDPSNYFRQKPLVASFRVRGPDASEAFTFTLVNIHVSDDSAKVEIDLLDDVLKTVRNDPRGEDDVILLGDFNADDKHLGQLGRLPRITCVITDFPTTTRGSRLSDNIVFDRLTTLEFTGRSGVVDIMRELNLPMEEAINISRHLPVWAEFSIFEGGHAGQLSLKSNLRKH